MFAVRIYGYGGQGSITIAETLAVAAFSEGKYALAFPGLRTERAATPMVTCCRIDEIPVSRHAPVLHPDAVIVQDSTLLRQVDVLDGIRPDGHVLVNSAHDAGELGLDDLAARHGLPAARILAVPATEITRRALGHPLPNAALLGAFAAQTQVVTLLAVETAIREGFAGRVATDNIEAARAAHAFVRYVLRDGAPRVASRGSDLAEKERSAGVDDPRRRYVDSARPLSEPRQRR
jgi:pyruvate ferredoxin oxidoreductase gamma subunit